MEKADEGEALILEKRMPNRKLLADIGYMKDVAKKELRKEIEYVAEVVDLTNYCWLYSAI